MTTSGGVPFGQTPCAVCEEQAAQWLHHLDDVRSRFRVYGKGHVWGSPAAVCGSCDEVLTRGDIDALVSRSPQSRELVGEDLTEQVRNGCVALIGATVRRESVVAASPPGWQDAVAAGFTPMEHITGALHLVDGWPAQHRRSVPAADPDHADHLPDGRHWFIRSPWSSVDLEPLWHLVIQTIESAPGHGDGAFTSGVHRAEVAAVRDLAMLDEQAILQRIRRLRDQRS